MIAGITFPEWKRFDTQFINPDALNLSLSDNDGKAEHDKYARSLSDILHSKYIIGSINGYLTENSAELNSYMSLKPIDLEHGRQPSDRLFSLIKSDNFGRGKFHAMDESFKQIDEKYAKGFYIRLKKDMPEPLVEFVKVTQNNAVYVHHDLIILEPGTKLVMLRVIESGDDGMIADNLEAYIGKGAKLEYVTLNKSKKGVFYTAIKRATVAGQGIVNWYNIDLKESHSAISVRSILAEPYAESRMTGVIMGIGESRKDISYETLHNAPDTVTSVLMRAAVLDRAKVIYRALTHIASGSKRSKVEQVGKSIMLGKHAKFNGIPSLWIDEDDVAASHSASSGMVDERTMFYLKSRGISHKQAEKLVTDGFIASLLTKEPINLLSDLY